MLGNLFLLVQQMCSWHVRERAHLCVRVRSTDHCTQIVQRAFSLHVLLPRFIPFIWLAYTPPNPSNVLAGYADKLVSPDGEADQPKNAKERKFKSCEFHSSPHK